MNAQIKAEGPLFQHPDLAASLARGMGEAVALAGQRMRQILSGHRGPGRYGHLADAVRTQVIANGYNVQGRVYPGGKGAFKGVFLEKGTVGHFISPRIGGRRRSGAPVLRRRALVFNGVFRPYAHHPGTTGVAFAERTLDETWPQVKAILQDAVVRPLGG